jgi:hypothetical protein
MIATLSVCSERSLGRTVEGSKPVIMLGKGSRSSSILPRMWGDTFGSRDLESPLHTTPAILTCPCQRGSTTPDLNCRHPRVTQHKRRPLCCKLWLFASPLTERSAVMSQEKYIGMDVHQSNDRGCSRGSPVALCVTPYRLHKYSRGLTVIVLRRKQAHHNVNVFVQRHQNREWRALVLGNSSTDIDNRIFGKLAEHSCWCVRVTCDPHPNIRIAIL